jgi:tetratricopeptide (TPR) repeat protein
MLEVIVDKETDKHLSDAEWRDLNLEGGGGTWKYFETGGWSCGETTILMEGSGSHDYHGFTVRGGHRFDLSLSESLSDQHKANVPRELFDRLAKSFRLGLVRLGTWNQMPAAALDFMDAAFKRSDDWKTWLDEQQKAKPEDYSIPFAKAELLRFYESKPEEQMPAYARAIEILAAKKDCTAADRLAHAASEDGMALAFLEKSETSEVEKALPHLESALKIAGNLTAPVRAMIQYDQARVHAHLGHAEIAIGLVRKSEAEDPGAIDRARVDKEFEAMRQSPELQELFHGDRKNG